MARLIDADALPSALFQKHVHYEEELEPMLYFEDAVKVVEDAPTIDAAPVEATAKKLQRAFFSDNWEAWAEWLRGNYSDEDFLAHKDDKIDAIPIAWLEAQIVPFSDKLKDEVKGVFNATIREMIYRWRQEQEGQDG